LPLHRYRLHTKLLPMMPRLTDMLLEQHIATKESWNGHNRKVCLACDKRCPSRTMITCPSLQSFRYLPVFTKYLQTSLTLRRWSSPMHPHARHALCPTRAGETWAPCADIMRGQTSQRRHTKERVIDLPMAYGPPCADITSVRSPSVCPDPLTAGRGSGASSKWGCHTLPDVYAVLSAVLKVVRHPDVLRCFIWDGEELPPYDDMWFALCILCICISLSLSLSDPSPSIIPPLFSAFSCPCLKFISMTLGSILPSPNSHVRVTPRFSHGGSETYQPIL
jgi:hypothetical protein